VTSEVTTSYSASNVRTTKKKKESKVKVARNDENCNPANNIKAPSAPIAPSSKKIFGTGTSTTTTSTKPVYTPNVKTLQIEKSKMASTITKTNKSSTISITKPNMASTLTKSNTASTITMTIKGGDLVKAKQSYQPSKTATTNSSKQSYQPSKTVTTNSKQKFSATTNSKQSSFQPSKTAITTYTSSSARRPFSNIQPAAVSR
jgi:hypothetical protein